MFPSLGAGLLALGLAGGVAAPAAEAPCAAPEYRQFDFWLGEWEVWGGADGGQLLGRNTIARAASGCALTEHWRNARGTEGRSLNAYDRARGAWVQFWVGADGVILRLEGGLSDGAMVMHGELPAAGGGRQRQRIAWTPQPDGSVVQRWDVSDDDGGSWTTSFLGVYRRPSSPAPP